MPNKSRAQTALPPFSSFPVMLMRGQSIAYLSSFYLPGSWKLPASGLAQPPHGQLSPGLHTLQNISGLSAKRRNRSQLPGMVHKVPAHKNLICSLKKDRAELESDAKHVCIETVPRWEGLKDSEIEVGLTRSSFDLTYTRVCADVHGSLN